MKCYLRTILGVTFTRSCELGSNVDHGAHVQKELEDRRVSFGMQILQGVVSGLQMVLPLERHSAWNMIQMSRLSNPGTIGEMRRLSRWEAKEGCGGSHAFRGNVEVSKQNNTMGLIILNNTSGFPQSGDHGESLLLRDPKSSDLCLPKREHLSWVSRLSHPGITEKGNLPLNSNVPFYTLLIFPDL